MMYEIYKELINTISQRERAVLATVISSRGSAPRHVGAKMLFKHDGTTVGTVGGGGVEQQVREKAVEMLNSGNAQIIHFDLSGNERNATMICGGQMDVFLEPVAVKDTLFLFGAGHISRIVAAVGKILGFTVIVIDPRPEYNNRERFPDADSLETENYEGIFPKLQINESSYIVICTPGHVYDEQCLRFAAGTGAKYIGMIGSDNKVKQVKERLMQQDIPAQQLDSLYAPVGIEIQAETPAEIAVSILAEIIKIKNSTG